MIKPKSQRPKLLELDLSGPEGNAFCLIGYAQKFCKELGMEPKPIVDDMMSGDYDHLIEIFDKHFGAFVTLYR